MAIVLYEGFNFSTSDSPKLDTNYWSTNDLTKITYTTGRTGNQIAIDSHNWNTATPTINSLTLSNFDDPLSTNNCFAFGFAHDTRALAPTYEGTPGATAPFRAKYMEFKDASNNIVLKFNLISTSYLGVASLGLEIEQSGSPVTVYDFRSYVGHSWGFATGSPYITNRIYLEFFIDAKNQNKMSIRVSQDGGTIHGYLLNSSGLEDTNITGFTSLGSVTWFGKNDATIGSMTIDDLYFSRGDTALECYLGMNTKIYRLNLAANGDTLQWTPNNTNNQFENLNNSDGDSNYIYSSINNSGDLSIFDLGNLPVNPSNVSIVVKPINIVRKTGDSDIKFTNVMTSGVGGSVTNLGSEQTVSSLTYNMKSELISINPVTGNPWTVSDINNMQIGVKNLGGATS